MFKAKINKLYVLCNVVLLITWIYRPCVQWRI